MVVILGVQMKECNHLIGYYETEQNYCDGSYDETNFVYLSESTINEWQLDEIRLASKNPFKFCPYCGKDTTSLVLERIKVLEDMALKRKEAEEEEKRLKALKKEQLKADVMSLFKLDSLDSDGCYIFRAYHNSLKKNYSCTGTPSYIAECLRDKVFKEMSITSVLVCLSEEDMDSILVGYDKKKSLICEGKITNVDYTKIESDGKKVVLSYTPTSGVIYVYEEWLDKNNDVYKRYDNFYQDKLSDYLKQEIVLKKAL